MDFLNSLSTRIPLAVVGGILYALLARQIILLLGLPFELATLGALIVFLFYLGSRLLILFSGINSPYYSRERKAAPSASFEKNQFYQTTQWVGTFYHYHDIVLFVFMILLSVALLVTLIIDWAGNKPIGDTIQNLFMP